MSKASFVTWMILLSLVVSCSYSHTDDGYKINSDGVIVTSVPHRAKGQTDVSYMSATLNAVGSSLFPAPMELINGIPCSLAVSASASLADTVSTASTI